jgi:hypothetical protein
MKTDLCPRVTNLPPVAVVEQVFARPREPDVRAAVVREMDKIFPDTAPLRDKVVGLTMPSRGIRDIQDVVRAAVEFLKPRCEEVRVLTAMGTHGGGTADGERDMARSRGVTEASVGARICSSMETRHIATVDCVEVHVSGKDKSGQGMHTKTIGRSPYGYVQGTAWKPSMPRIHTIIGGRLTAGSHGNAIGVGLCQFMTRRFDDAVDWERTALNCLCSPPTRPSGRSCARMTGARWNWRSPCARQARTASARPSSSAHSR